LVKGDTKEMAEEGSTYEKQQQQQQQQQQQH
jgi:hypothetical protein